MTYPKNDYWNAQTPEFREEVLGHVITMEREYAARQRERAERAERLIAALRIQAAVPHSAFDNPANMILPIRELLGVEA